jgi:hypothetical protein
VDHSCQILNNNEISPNQKTWLTKITFQTWAPSAHTVIFLKIPPIQFYFGGWFSNKLLEHIHNNKRRSWENSHFVSRDSSEESLFLELKCSHSLGTDVWWINWSLPNTYKDLSNVLVLVKWTYIHKHKKINFCTTCVNPSKSQHFFQSRNTLSLTYTQIHTHIYISISMQLNRSWKAISQSATQEFPSALKITEVHCPGQNSPPLVLALSQINPVHTTPSSLSKLHFNIILSPTSRSF